MLILHPWIILSSSFTPPSRMYISSKQCKNFCAISSTVLTRGESSDYSNPSSFYLSMHLPIFVLGLCMLKWSLLSLCSGINLSGLCLSFDHIRRLFIIKENSWLSRSYSLAKYNSWTCALLDISTRDYPIISSTFLCIFGDTISSIGCECAILTLRSDKEDICSRIIWF